MKIKLHDAVIEAKLRKYNYVAIDSNKSIYAYGMKPTIKESELYWSSGSSSICDYMYLGEYDYPVKDFRKMIVKVSDVL